MFMKNIMKNLNGSDTEEEGEGGLTAFHPQASFSAYVVYSKAHFVLSSEARVEHADTNFTCAGHQCRYVALCCNYLYNHFTCIIT